MRSYNLTDTFDIELGMAVFDSEGRKIGTVSNIAGFGSGQVGGGSRTEASVTRASGGTGHFDVDRSNLPPGKSQPLCLSFSAIDKVVRDHGVVLTAAAATQISPPEAEPPPAAAVPAKGRGLRFWRGARR
ncbi:MAG TPA: hypothetical protein VFB34_12875 [Chloroflexota bacterium]|nr:hypothetical protein [Chloroflexota bacterium]